MAAAQFWEVPGYAALILRRTYAELAKAGALMERSKMWWAGRKAEGVTWNGEEHRWRFPSGASIEFGHLESENDKYRYQSSEFQFIGFDELSQFLETQYTYLFSRLRRLRDSGVPLRMRAGSNPGGVGHIWVKKRFMSADKPGRFFVPAKLDDNPHIDRLEYRASLAELPLRERKQLEEGDWSDLKGEVFDPSSWPRYADIGTAYKLGRRIIYTDDLPILVAVDPAATDGKKSDHTAFVVAALTPDGELLILEVVNAKWPLKQIMPELAMVCRRWRPAAVGIEAVSFQAKLVDDARRFHEIPEVIPLMPHGKNKRQRAVGAILMGENGRIWLPPSAPWLDEYMLQLSSFTGLDDREQDDMVDATAYLPVMREMWDSGGNEQPIGVFVGGKSRL